MKRAVKPAMLLNDIEDIAGAASHELRDPLRQALAHCLELRAIIPATALPYLEALEQDITTVLERVAIIRAYSHLVRSPVLMEPVDIAAIVQEAANRCAVLCRAKNATITIRPMPVAMAEARQLTLMLEQLIDNALRHNPSSQPTVTLTSTKKGKHWHLRVEDNGPGIDADYRRLVMGLFRTVGNPHLPEGHGAGLAFCARIARHHGGQLRINSSRLGGTSMQFTLMEARHDD